jgi:hypothetical protein
MTIVIYSIENCKDKLNISNFEYFISYGLLNDKWVAANNPITTLIVFVNNKDQFNNKFNLDDISIELIVLETTLVSSIDIIKEFYNYVKLETPLTNQ